MLHPSRASSRRGWCDLGVSVLQACRPGSAPALTEVARGWDDPAERAFATVPVTSRSNIRSRLRRFISRGGSSSEKPGAAVNVNPSDASAAADPKKPPSSGPVSPTRAATSPKRAKSQLAAIAVPRVLKPDGSARGGVLKSALAFPGRNRNDRPQHRPCQTVRWAGVEYVGIKASIPHLVDGDDMEARRVVEAHPILDAANGRQSPWGGFFARKQHGGAAQAAEGAQQPVHCVRGEPPAAQSRTGMSLTAAR